MDWSGSPGRKALDEAWDNVRAELPTIIETRHIRRLLLWRFDEDGCSPLLIQQFALPALEVPVQAETSSGEWDSFSNRREAVQDEAVCDWEVKRQTALNNYGPAITDALRPVDSATVLPEVNRKAQRTDIFGLLRRIALQWEPDPGLRLS